DAGWRLDRPARLADLRRSQGSLLGRTRPPVDRLRICDLRVRGPRRGAALEPRGENAADRAVPVAPAAPRARPDRARDLRDPVRWRGVVARRALGRRRRSATDRWAAGGGQLRRPGVQPEPDDRPP